MKHSRFHREPFLLLAAALLLVPGCNKAEAPVPTDPEPEVLRGAINSDVDLAPFFEGITASCEERKRANRGFPAKCLEAQREYWNLMMDRANGNADRTDLESSRFASGACNPYDEQSAAYADAVQSVICWAALSPDPLGYLADPKPYSTEGEWSLGTRGVGRSYRFDPDSLSLAVSIVMDWERVEGGDFVLSVMETNYAGVPPRTKTVFFSDPCLSGFIDKMDLKGFGGPSRPIRAAVRIDALGALDECPGIARISLLPNEQLRPLANSRDMGAISEQDDLVTGAALIELSD